MKIVDLKTLVSLPKGTLFIPFLSGAPYDEVQVLGEVEASEKHGDIKYFSVSLDEVDTGWQSGPNISPNICYHVYEEEDLLTVLENVQNALKVLGTEIPEG